MNEDQASMDRWQIQLRKGSLELVVLAALKGDRVYGLDLLRRLQEFPTTAISEGTLYPLLERLKRDELVDARWVQEGESRPRKYYTLTPVGEQKLGDLIAIWRRSVADIEHLLSHPGPQDIPPSGQ